MYDVAVRADVVVAPVDLNHAGTELLDAINVVAEHTVVIIANPVLNFGLNDNHLGIRTKFIGTLIFKPVRRGGRNKPRRCCKRIVCFRIVVVSLPQEQASVIEHTVLGVVVQAISCVLEYACNVPYKLTVCIKLPSSKIIA